MDTRKIGGIRALDNSPHKTGRILDRIRQPFGFSEVCHGLIENDGKHQLKIWVIDQSLHHGDLALIAAPGQDTYDLRLMMSHDNCQLEKKLDYCTVLLLVSGRVQYLGAKRNHQRRASKPLSSALLASSPGIKAQNGKVANPNPQVSTRGPLLGYKDRRIFLSNSKFPFTRFQQSLLQPTRFTLIMLHDVAQQRTSQQSQHAEPCHWSVQVSICILLQVGFFLYHLEKFLPCQCGAVPPAISLSFLRILGFYLDLWQSPALRLEAKRLKKRKPSGWVQTSRRRNKTWLIHLWSDHKATKLHRPHLSGGLKHKSLAMSQPHENAG